MNKEQNLDEQTNPALMVNGVDKSVPSQAELVAETADAYCHNCEAYIVNERVTHEDCCDTCGTEIEWHD